MKCLVINGTEQTGCTYHLKNMFIDELKPTELREFYLPKDAPDYCIGCKACFLKSETLCPHYDKVAPIWQALLEADLIVFAYPVYVYRTPGQVKSLLDHLGVHWMVHRPKSALFNKTAVIITQSLAAPNRGAQLDVKTSLNWLGIPKVKRIGFSLREGTIWANLSEARRQQFETKIRHFARQFRNVTPVGKSPLTNIYFQACKRMHQNRLDKTPPQTDLNLDTKYWLEQGWIKQK